MAKIQHHIEIQTQNGEENKKKERIELTRFEILNRIMR